MHERTVDRFPSTQGRCKAAVEGPLEPQRPIFTSRTVDCRGPGGCRSMGGFNWGLELANTESFCISCHEMRNTPYAELQNTIHYKNRSGVRATCPDCHVPKEWIYKVMAKIEATTDLYHHIMGSVDTVEEFGAKRAVLAQRVWTTMKETDSRACRNCHSTDSMDPHKQSPASQVMLLALKSGATCITGLPQGYCASLAKVG